ncbi:hypothetical protein RGQ21_22410 [Kitasatospora aureofaciens]|nr:hypothetical protein RGQ21_22410 [Kitasatospora aureofaciens]
MRAESGGQQPLEAVRRAGPDRPAVRESSGSNRSAERWRTGHSGIGRPLREGHSGVWRSDAGHEDARERRTVPE